jgi:hypothetical protein
MTVLFTDALHLCSIWPIRNRKWSASDSCFIVDASELGLAPGEAPTPMNVNDPWNRLFPNPSFIQLDMEGDILYWEFMTTVEGQKFQCKIFND